MPTGTGAINLRNLPPTKYVINPGLFNQLTSRVVFDPVNFALPSFGNYKTDQLLQTGIVSKLRLIVEGTITTTGAPPNIVPTAHYPWNLISLRLSGNGQNNFINADGWDLRLRMFAQNRAFNDTFSTFPAAGGAPFNAAGSADFRLVYDVPIAMDDVTLVGSLYAQSEATNLTYTVSTRAQADLFDVVAGTIAIAATVYLEETTFEVPYDPRNPEVLVIPDLTVLHGFVANDNMVASQSSLETNLFRVNGQLERLFFYTVDKTTAARPAFLPTSSYTQSQLIYGSNITPYTFNPQRFLQARNNLDNRLATPDGTYVLDFIAENPVRDQVLLEGVTNLRLRTQYGVVPTGGSYVHFVQETLFA